MNPSNIFARDHPLAIFMPQTKQNDFKRGQLSMKSIKKLFAMGLAVMMALSIPFSVSAAELEDAPIDESRTGSLAIYKYDLTNGATRS